MAVVTLVNYGLGNIEAFAHIYKKLNISFDVAKTPDQLSMAKRIILPGVGAFDWAITRLNNSGLRDTLDEMVLGKKVPVLGVCVGMQIMAELSEEGVSPGLSWIDGEVVRFKTDIIGDAPLPHMGWNDVQPTESETLFRGVEDPRYYFLHSYCIVPRNTNEVLATAHYGGAFTAAIRSRHIFGTQFHPEKSHQWGIDLLRNFADL
jgi:glutamine amidotransferase